MREDFAVFILTHGRPNKQKTVETLTNAGYKGRLYYLCDNTDETLEEYKKKYGDKVVVFDKFDYIASVDTMDNFKKMNCVVYARNAVFDIARNMGIKYFVMCDDDITVLRHRWLDNGKLKSKKVERAEDVFSAVVKFLQNDNIEALTFGSQREYIGGKTTSLQKGLTYNLNQIMFCKTDCPLEFIGTFNEDFQAFILTLKRGKLIFSINSIMILSPEIRSGTGGMQDAYNEFNDYVIDFYSVMCAPSCVWIGNKNKLRRNEDAIVPKILSERWKK